MDCAVAVAVAVVAVAVAGGGAVISFRALGMRVRISHARCRVCQVVVVC